MADENTVFDAAFEYQMNGMSPEAAAEAGAHSDSQDARIAELEETLTTISSCIQQWHESPKTTGTEILLDLVKSTCDEALEKETP
jgi:hypothetical protein